MLVIKDHKIDGIDYIPSPNCEERPKNFFPEIIVIHAISLPKGKYITKNIVDLFTNNLGIELEGSDHDDFDERQYNSLDKILVTLMEYYGIKKKDIVGHSDIAPDRKTDPGPRFDWNRIK